MAKTIETICAPSGYKSVFILGKDARLWELKSDQTWRCHGHLPNSVAYRSNFTCVSNENNYIGLFVLGKDGKLYERYFHPVRDWLWSETDHGPVPGGEGLYHQAIAAIAVGRSNVSVFCFGRDNQLHERRFVVGIGWQWIPHGNPLPGVLKLYPEGMAVAASSQGKISLLLWASDGRVHERFFDGRGPIGDTDRWHWRQYDPPSNNVALRDLTCVALPNLSIWEPKPEGDWPFWAFAWGTDQCLYRLLKKDDGIPEWDNHGSPADGVGDIWGPEAVTAVNAGSIASVFMIPQHGTAYLYELRYTGEWRWLNHGPSIIGRAHHPSPMVAGYGDYLSVFTHVLDHVAECCSSVETWPWYDRGVPPYAKPTCNMTASPNPIQQGQSSTLSWTSANAERAHIKPDIGSVPLNGQKQVSPSSTTVYALSVMGVGGSDQSEVTVNVEQPTTGTLTIHVLFDLGPGRWSVVASVTGKVINYTGTPGQTSFSEPPREETFQGGFLEGSIAFVKLGIVRGEWEVTATVTGANTEPREMSHTCPAHVPGHIEVDFRGSIPHCHTL